MADAEGTKVQEAAYEQGQAAAQTMTGSALHPRCQTKGTRRSKGNLGPELPRGLRWSVLTIRDDRAFWKAWTRRRSSSPLAAGLSS
jgi:hypothetical protein